MHQSIAFRLAFFILICLSATNAQAQSNWDAYEPARFDTLVAAFDSTLSAAQQRSQKTDPPGHLFWPLPQHAALRSVVRYSGQSRATKPMTKVILEKWLKLRGMDPAYVDFFEVEVLFEQNGRQYWMPVQRGPLEYMLDEFKAGDELEVYVSVIGPHAEQRGDPVWIFAVNEYNVQ